MAPNMHRLAGTWKMDHDGWQGTLVINPSDQAFNEVDGLCVYHGFTIDGTWTGSDGAPLGVNGSFGGHDVNHRTGEECPASDHKTVFTIAFPGAPPQTFEGYIFTHETGRMAGLTWWHGIPFAWTATKTG